MTDFENRDLEKKETETAEDSSATGEKGKKGNKPYSFLRELIKDVLIAAVIVIAITAVIKPTIVKETSMLDTLQENNYVLVNKMAYKLNNTPEYGDIIVFKSNLVNQKTGKDMFLIKRVIGVEGDVISFENNKLYRNGEIVKEDYLYNERPEERGYPNGAVYTVGDNEVFVMGDHRSASSDSRSSSIGNVSEDVIMGKAFLRLFPFNEIELF